MVEADPGPLQAVQQVAVPDVPIPYARSLEYTTLPRQDRIEAAVRAVLA